ncbi:AAA family ATPase [Paraburkholderia unamae]|uniref:ATPase n=1 Tax=Paraburkholderia unamae TaxID=219649 RepID=A0ABX5KUN4_9BURK|nr:AAA family ATPase [Paraburkholderia unamae]PVX84930.1 putative ATPase [Paraburkholderia unamae]RAR65976.1 putative ATPase [Paraburkholderia unamae]CAG9266673.1 ATPase [Paraburkholderia unamae]
MSAVPGDAPGRFVVLTGCSGGGKSTVLAELARRGHAVVAEPGRRVVQAQMLAYGRALPWLDLAAFLHHVIDVARDDLASAPASGWVFFDRGLIDAAVALAHLQGTPLQETLEHAPRFYRRVFVAPPWPEIYVQDDARRHDLASANAEYERLRAAYPALGYTLTPLPKTGVAERSDFILATLRADNAGMH